MAKLFYTFSDQSLSVFVRDTLQTIPATHPGFEKLKAHLTDPTLEDHDELLVAELLDKRELVSRLTAGLVTVVGNEVFYKGGPVRSTLTAKLIELLDAGMDATPWVWFLNNVMENPSDRSKECLYNFIDHFQAPLTPDGCFVAFKYVRDDFGSAHANPDGTRMDNTPGKVVEMPREEVNPDPNQTCSTGLHVCASSYLGGYAWNNKVVACKVNPRDVVAVPTDYGFSKMRVCRYEVLFEMENEHDVAKVETETIVNTPVDKTPLPVDLQDVPAFTTRVQFDEYWTEMSEDPSEGTLVVKGNGCVVGIVTDLLEDYEPAETEWEWDEDLQEEVEVEVGEDTYYTVYTVVWQNGIKEDVYVEDFDVMPLTVVEHYEDEDEVVVEGGTVDHQMDAMQYIKEDKPARSFTHEATGKTFTVEALQTEVQTLGQRGFSRLHGVPRTTLQGWLASI